MGFDVNGEILGDAFKDYNIIITGVNDKQRFTMKQGILVNGRVRILMKESKLIFIIPILGKVFSKIHFMRQIVCWPF
jgi:ribosomal protein S6E (S10)